MRFGFAPLFLASVLFSLAADADLNDDFVFSSKFGLSTESVTTSWQSTEDGLIFGGQLNGVPRDTWHENFFLNGRLSKVIIGYHFNPLNFETELAARRWAIAAARSIIEKANSKYGQASEFTFNCTDEADTAGCEGKVVWRGSRKVFEINAIEVDFDDVTAAYVGFDRMIQTTFSYSTAEDYDLLSARLPSLVKQRLVKNARRTRSMLNRELGHYFKKRKMTLDEYIMEAAEANGKMNAILRKGSVEYIGGVKANYHPDKWARSFRLQ